jgi:BirA family biotin operon repressor/biotin-[acetyl-CoA-carboxylase] ligase
VSDDLSQTTVEDSLKGAFGRPLRFFEEIGSTNTEALGWASDAAPEGALVVTNHQTQGRGRWGRSWSSAPGKLLQFSLVLRPRLAPDELGLITTALGVACAVAIRNLCALEPTIKWPNDVRVGGRKVAGILVESELSGGSVDVAVAGMGVNVGWVAEEVPEELQDTTTSLAIELGSGREIDRAQLLAGILTTFESRYLSLPASGESLVEEASERSDVLGRDVVVALSTDETISGRAVRLRPGGELELETEDGLRVLSVGEIARLR